MTRSIGTAAACAVVVLTGLTLFAQLPAPPVGGRLAGAVLLGERPLAAAELPADLPSSDRLRILGYLDRKPAEGIDRQIVAAIEAEGIEAAARSVAERLATTAGTDAEATAAEALVRDRTHAAAAPFLYAYLASRYRLQFEQAPDDRALLERLAKKYRTMIDRVRNGDDALFRILADDLDHRPALTAGATRHPRQYLPDT